MFKRILIANRGEIAVRIIRACRTVGSDVVAVYSDVDRDALHVEMADARVGLGPAAAARSYLNQDSLIGAALLTGADAVHPGYGFLAENADFAARCSAVGLTFIGPTPQQIRMMADKAEARSCALAAGVPIVPGLDDEACEDVDHLAARGAEIGFPLMIKAAAGGGGRGMVAVLEPSRFKDQLSVAMAEARAAFCDGRVYLERFIANARHVEVQVLGDGMGSVTHLGERDCSVQRRHQKLIEESPSPGLTPALRSELCEAAVRLAQSVDYAGAGTVEFLVDMEQDAFYFIEMNTRIQVEHPVTEAVTGEDLVACQIRIAVGDNSVLPDLSDTAQGHAIECRINAEDPDCDFRPSPGTITRLHMPGGPGIRFDSHCRDGTEITAHYDSMIAKVITWGRDRQEGLERMRAALHATRIEGVKTTIPASLRILEHEEFIAARHTTRWLEDAL